MSYRCLETCTGCVYLSASSTSLPLWSTVVCTARRTVVSSRRLITARRLDSRRRRLRSSSSDADVVPPARLCTVVDRAFPVAASGVWNGLPTCVMSSPPLRVFKRHLKTVLFIGRYQPQHQNKNKKALGGDANTVRWL